MLRGGEILGNGKGDFPGGEPFAGAVERGDEADALERLAVFVAHGGVEDGAFAVANDHHHGFMPLAFLAPSRGKDLHVFGWAAQGIVEFILGVLPFGGHALGDWVGFA